jgi:23S rRNA (adenine2503-C2)-methyltransferase
MKQDIRDLSLKELSGALKALGEPPHRARQISRWLYGKNALSFQEMTDLPKDLIKKLGEKFSIDVIAEERRAVSRDGTQKFLWRLRDGENVESVLIPSASRMTLCVSTQAGCKFRCPFCASGANGFSRNLSMAEITGQIVSAQRISAEKITNLVFMGMGEPLDNYENLEKAIHLINHAEGMALGARKITVSTCGIIPGILRLKDIGIQVELSVSLHAANDTLRNKLVPANRKYGLSKLIEACAVYTEETGRIITLEYTLIKDVNDSPADANETAKIARTLKAKVNLIRCNSFEGSEYEPPPQAKADFFATILRERKVNVTTRRSKGGDILASCGQLTKRRGRTPDGASKNTQNT